MNALLSRFRRATAAVAATVVLTATAATAAPAPTVNLYNGDRITVKHADGTQHFCTVNSVADRDGALYAITAGHCISAKGPKKPVRILASDDRTVIASDMKDSGYYLDGSRNFGDPFRDVGWFRLDGNVRPTHTMRGGNITTHVDAGLDKSLTDLSRQINRPIAVGGRISLSSIRPGHIVCKDGGRSGRTCGPVLRVNPRSGEIYSLLFTIPGDSGSPIYIIGRDGKAYIVAVHGGGATPYNSDADAVLPLPAGLK